MNKVMLIGCVVEAPEIRFAGAAQTAFTEIRVEVTMPRGKKEEKLGIDVVAWARQAEMAVQYLKKGRLIGIDGRLKSEEETDASGKKVVKVKVVADRIIYLPAESKAEDHCLSAAEGL